MKLLDASLDPGGAFGLVMTATKTTNYYKVYIPKYHHVKGNEKRDHRVSLKVGAS